MYCGSPSILPQHQMPCRLVGNYQRRRVHQHREALLFFPAEVLGGPPSNLCTTSNSYPPWEVSQLEPTILELIPLQAGSLNLLTLLPRSFSLTAIFPSTKENSHAFPRLADWYHWLHPAVEVTGKLDPGLGREGLPAQLFASLCVTLTLLASHPVQCRWVPIPIAKFSLQCMQTFMALETATSVVITIYWK